MCNYCGCRDFPLIGRFSAEHVRIGEVARTLADRVDADEAMDGARP